MRTEYSSLIKEENSMVTELNNISVNVGIWENEPNTNDDANTHKRHGGSDNCVGGISRIKDRQIQLLEFHAKIGALDRKVSL